MNTANSQPSHNDDEIDLFELVVTLWRSKGVIIAITLLCTILAGLVAFFVIKPTYQAEAMINEPNTYQIEALNRGIILLPEESSNDQAVKKLSPAALMKPLTQSLNSMGIQRQFFAEKYIPMFSGDDAVENNQQAFHSFRSNLSIKENQSKTGSTISFAAGTPKIAYDVVTQFLDFADNQASNVILENRKSEINTFITNLESTLSGIRSEMDTKTAYKIREYQNALATAESLDIHNPVIDGTELFQQGAVALKDKIKFLESERNDYSQSTRFNTLTMMINSYKAITLPDAKEIATFQYTFAPELPEKPTKPNKKLIVVIGFLLGGMLAVMFVLLRQAIRNYQLRSKAAQ